MSAHGQPTPEVATGRVPSPRPGWAEFASSSDHKDTGRVFIVAALGFLALAAVEFFLMRLQLAVPDNTLIAPITFNRLLSVFGVTTLALFALPLAFGFFTYVVPLQIGARGLAFPRLGSLALWLYLAGAAVVYASFFYTPPELGSPALPPMSGDLAFLDNNGTDVWIMALGLVTLGLVLQSINLAVTVARERAPGMAWRRLAPFSVAGAASSWLMIVIGPVMLAALVMLIVDRHFGGVFFAAGEGGTPTYFQHIATIFGTGGFLVVALFALGVISETVETFSGRPLRSRRGVGRSLVAIAILGVPSWMQSLYAGNIAIGWLYGSMLFAIALLVPFGFVYWSWITTLVGGGSRDRAPLILALGAATVLSFGLLGALMTSLIPIGLLLDGTTDWTAEAGALVLGGGVLAGFAALQYWMPKMTGRALGEGPAKLALLLVMIGAAVTLLPMWLAGLAGQPANTYRYFEGEGLDTLNLLSSIGSLVLLVGILIALVNAVLGAGGGRKVGHDPWGGGSLEWLALSPPPPHNFDLVPDVRSDEPMRDIREGIGAARGIEADPEPASKAQSVA